MIIKKTISLSLIIAICFVINFSELDINTKKGLCIFTIAAILWMTETIHLTATALLIPLLSVAFGVFDVKQALVNYAHPIIFIFLGGFALATALSAKNLDKIIAHHILIASKGHIRIAVYLLFFMTALLSMWVSNTAVVAVMLPLALGILRALQLSKGPTSLFVLLGIAYSASIGGMGSLIGSPPNAIAAASLNLSFIDWMKIGLPIVIVMLPLLIASLQLWVKPQLNGQVELALTKPKAEPGSGLVIAIFITTALLWLFGKPIGSYLGIDSYFDSWVALGAVIALVATNSLKWKEVETNTDWGILLLFGGGLTLSTVLQSTGASLFIANTFAAYLEGMPLLPFVFFTVLFIIFLTELTSNTATAALFIPLFVGIATQLNFPTELIVMAIGLAASNAFMLPVATPPNAVVFGSGLIKQSQMMKAGIVLNLVASATLPLLLFVWVSSTASA